MSKWLGTRFAEGRRVGFAAPCQLRRAGGHGPFSGTPILELHDGSLFEIEATRELRERYGALQETPG